MSKVKGSLTTACALCPLERGRPHSQVLQFQNGQCRRHGSAQRGRKSAKCGEASSTEVPLAQEGELGSCAAPVWDRSRGWWTLRDLVGVCRCCGVMTAKAGCQTGLAHVGSVARPQERLPTTYLLFVCERRASCTWILATDSPLVVGT